MRDTVAVAVDTVLARAVDVLGGLPGFAGLALGGSRARGTADEHSDVDLGLYCSAPAPVAELAAAFRRLDDRGEPDGWAAHGGWGPWIDGGAWPRVDGYRVDVLLRDVRRVREGVAECVAGRPGIHCQPGHPHGFCTVIWAGEVHHNRPVADPDGVLAELRSLTEPYPAALRDALVERFGWEAGIALDTARSAAARGDGAHVTGCAYRAVARVRAGESLIVTDRGRPILRMVPDVEPAGVLSRLVAEGTATAPVEQGLPELIDDLVPEVDSLTDLLLAERERDR